MPEVSLKELIASGAHFGHQSKRWNPKMQEYLYGAKDGVHIFDLTKTKEKLDEALELLKTASRENKVILFVGTKKQVKAKIMEVAKETGTFYVNERWLGGTLTNFEQMKKSTHKLKETREGLLSGKFKDRTKKERLIIEREIARLERFFGGVVEMTQFPDIIIIVDIRREHTAVKEARFKGIESIAIVDTNSDPTLVDHPIPMNDDASRALEYVLDLMKEAIMERKERKTRNVIRDTKSNRTK